MIRRPPRSTQSRSSAASDVYKRQITITSLSAGTNVINATATWTVNGVSITRTTGDNLHLDGSNVQKTFVDASISLSPLTKTNFVGTNHTITATVTQDLGTGSGPVPAPAGVTVTFSIVSGDATFFGPSTCLTDINGMCSIQITSPNAGNNVIHATTTFTVSGVSLTRSTQSLSSSLCTAFLQPVAGCDAQKTFIPRTPLLLTTVLLGDPGNITGFNLAGTADFTLYGPSGTTSPVCGC